jgi:hypothetical protein
VYFSSDHGLLGVIVRLEADVDGSKDGHDGKHKDQTLVNVRNVQNRLQRSTKHGTRCSVPSIISKRNGTKLAHSHGTKQDDTGIEDEGAHHCFSHLHGVYGDEHKADTELNGTFDNAEEKPEGKDAIKDDTNEGDGIKCILEEGVQERCEAAHTDSNWKNVDDDVKKPS